MAKTLSKAARDALAATDWRTMEVMTDNDLARQIAANPNAAPDMAPEIDVRAIRRAAGMTQAEFAAVYEFSIRTVQEWERGAK
jgi:putative transcriptional regulator